MNEKPEPAATHGLEEAPASFAPDAASASDLRADELRGRDLRGRDLTKVEGLLPEHLAAADLTRAKLPPEIEKFPALDQVKAISAEARKVFLALLAACVYSWLVIGTTKDVALLLNTASSPLPIINTAIPIAGFYVIGASVLAAVYCYLHFYLQRLWRTLASLPAIFPDGVALDDKTDPWLLTNLVRAACSARSPRPSARAAGALLVRVPRLVACAAYPARFWARYLPAHGLAGTSGWSFSSASPYSLAGTPSASPAPLCGSDFRTAKQTDGPSQRALARAWRGLGGLRQDKLTGWLDRSAWSFARSARSAKIPGAVYFATPGSRRA